MSQQPPSTAQPGRGVQGWLCLLILAAFTLYTLGLQRYCR
jgi:hypothetical protein